VTLFLTREVAEAIAARAIREGTNVAALIGELGQPRGGAAGVMRRMAIGRATRGWQAIPAHLRRGG
jgi:hypothetical protein